MAVSVNGRRYVIKRCSPAPQDLALAGLIIVFTVQCLVVWIQLDSQSDSSHQWLVAFLGVVFLIFLYVYLRFPKVTLERQIGDPEWQIITHIPGKKRVKTVSHESIVFRLTVDHFRQEWSSEGPNNVYTYRLVAELPDAKPMVINRFNTNVPEKSPYSTELRMLNRDLDVIVKVDAKIATYLDRKK